MNWLNDLSSCELVALASIFSIYISQGLNEEEINTLGSFFSAIGDNLGIIGNKITDVSTNNCNNTSSSEINLQT